MAFSVGYFLLLVIFLIKKIAYFRKTLNAPGVQCRRLFFTDLVLLVDLVHLVCLVCLVIKTLGSWDAGRYDAGM